MVQLKAFSVPERAAENWISIPYGSIKSMFDDVANNFVGISIPYGSIKSSGELIRTGTCQISIPYGSIKRLISGCAGAHNSRFQFLMVQLKV